MQLRPYQEEAIRSVGEAWDSHRSVLITMPTGTGKTVVFMQVLLFRPGRSLVLAHRGELLEQARQTAMYGSGLSVEVEQAGKKAARSRSLTDELSRVVVASVQSLKGDRLKSWDPGAFQTIVVDEAHHAPAASYRAILDHFSSAKVLGVTATPKRADKIGLKGVFDHWAFSYALIDAIDDGWLCPIVQQSIVCADLDISRVKSRMGDLAANELEQAMTIDAVLHQIASPLVREAGDRPTIVFTVGVEQAKSLASVLCGYTDASKVASIDGETDPDERAWIIRKFKTGEVQFLVNCAVLTEGFDAPNAACIAIARPTKSLGLYTQMMGRGTRLHPGKENLLVLDFVGNSGRHRLVDSVDALAGRMLEDVAARNASRAPDGQDIRQTLADAEEAQRKRDAWEQRERERRRVHADVSYTSTLIQPFGGGAFAVAPDVTKAPPATAKQLQFLKNFGVTVARPPSIREAAELIDRLQSRRSKNLCTYKQAQFLARKGLRSDLTFPEARLVMDAIAQNSWVVPAHIKARFSPLSPAELQAAQQDA